MTGRIDPEGSPSSNPTGAPTPDRSPSPDKINLPEFEASAIREVSGTCPATPRRSQRRSTRIKLIRRAGAAVTGGASVERAPLHRMRAGDRQRCPSIRLPQRRMLQVMVGP